MLSMRHSRSCDRQKQRVWQLRQPAVPLEPRRAPLPKPLLMPGIALRLVHLLCTLQAALLPLKLVLDLRPDMTSVQHRVSLVAMAVCDNFAAGVIVALVSWLCIKQLLIAVDLSEQH